MKNKIAIDWLLEPQDIGVRYLALRDLVKSGPDELAEARDRAHKEGPIAQVLAKMNPEGYWEKAGLVDNSAEPTGGFDQPG
jgi:hypothetical protein